VTRIGIVAIEPIISTNLFSQQINFVGLVSRYKGIPVVLVFIYARIRVRNVLLPRDEVKVFVSQKLKMQK